MQGMQIGITNWLVGGGTLISAPSPPAGTITVANFARDRVIYDSGAAFGLDYAAVPVFISTSLPNQQVEARVVSTDDGGASSGPWVDMGLTSGVGTLAGSLTAVLNRSGYYKLEARLTLAPANTTSHHRPQILCRS